MSKKSKRTKFPRPMKQLQQPRAAVLPSQIHEQLAGRARYARQQILKGDFVGTISTCEALLSSVPKSSALRVEVLALLGLAHSMLRHRQECYDAFSEAIALDHTMPELWYNHGLACYHLGRYAESVRDYERAVELLGDDDTSEVARKITKELAAGRRQLQESMEVYGPDITLEQYTEREEQFTQALNLMKQEKWSEGEALFRQLAELGCPIPSYWGNLGGCLMMQGCYDEAEEALKQALAIDPDYSFARDNLQKLAQARLGKKPVGAQVFVDAPDEPETKQALTMYEHHTKGASITSTKVEKSGNTVTTTAQQQLGGQPPRYDLFLNHYEDARFTTCPRCKSKTRSLECTLVVMVNPAYAMIA